MRGRTSGEHEGGRRVAARGRHLPTYAHAGDKR